MPTNPPTVIIPTRHVVATGAAQGSIVQGPARYSYNPRDGFHWRTPYRGLAADINAFAALQETYGYGVDVEADAQGVFATCTVTTPGENPVHTWQLEGSRSEQSIWEHPKAQALKVYDPSAPAKLQALVNDYPGTVTSPFDLTKLPGGGGSGALVIGTGSNTTANRYAVDLFWQIVRGADHFGYAHYVLHHSFVVPFAFSSAVSTANVMQIYTTAQLLTEVDGMDSSFPSGMTTAINAIVAPMASPDRFLWGWLKSPASDNTLPNYRREISQYYELAMWSLFDYDAAGTASIAALTG